MTLPSGIDTAAKITADVAKKAAEAGQSFIGRYLVPTTGATASKALTAAEAKAIHSAGLGILLCWETTANRANGGAAAGAADGKVARQLAEKMLVPYGVAIYFAVDYNAPAQDYDRIEQYFRAAAAAVHPYDIGVYGSYYVCEAMYLRGVSKNLWQCCAWSGALISPHAYLYQRQWSGGAESRAVGAKLGISVDMNTCGNLSRAHIWMPGESLPEKPWYSEAMDWARENGICDGTRPEDTATRAEVAQMFYNLARIREPEDDKRFSGLLEDG